MDEHHRVALALLEVVQAYAVHLEEAADGWRLALGSPRLRDRKEGSRAQGRDQHRQSNQKPVIHLPPP